MALATRTAVRGIRIRADKVEASRLTVNGDGTSTTYAGERSASDFSLHLGDGVNYLGASAKAPALDIVPSGVASGNAMRSTADPTEYALANWTTRQLQAGVWRAFIYMPEVQRYVGVGDNVVQTSEDGITWVSRTSPGDRWWNRLAWAGDKRVLVAAAADPGANPIASSLDGGITWTARAAGSDPIGAIAYGGGQFVALTADGASHYTSPDGITWTLQAAVRRIWSGLVWAEELGRFVAVSVNGSGGQAATSEGGLSFTTRATPVESGVNAGWRDVAWSGSLQLFVAVAASGPAGRIMTSPDGITWTSRSTPEQGEWNRVVWAEELSLFVVVARAPGDRRFRGARTLTSPDGTNWTARVAHTEEGYGLHWVAGKGEMIMAADREQDRYLTQITPAWTRSSVTGTWTGVAWAPEIGRVVIAGNARMDFSTTGGTTWTAVSQTGTWRGVAWAPEINTFVAVADEGSTDLIAYSTTGGVSWVTLSTGGAGRQWQKLTWAPEISTFIAVAYSGHYARSTTGGTSWVVTSRANLWRMVVWAPEIRTFVKVANSGTNRISYSTTGGETWLDATGQTEHPWYGVAYSGELNRFVAVGVSAVSISTTGGVSWESRSIPAGTWLAVTWAPELRAFVAGGSSGVAAFSTTGGDSWVSFDRPSGDVYSVSWLREYGRLVAPDNSSGVSRLDYPRRINNLFLTNPAVSRPSWRTEALAGEWASTVWASQLSRFVAVSRNSLIAYSTTGGITWVTNTNTGTWTKVVWAPEINTFVAVGSGGRFAYSTTSGVTWVRSTFGSANFQGVAWAPAIQTFVAVANGAFARSTDGGRTWVTTNRTNDWSEVAWSEDLRMFVKVAQTGTNPRVSYSTTNGETWIDATLPSGAEAYFSVTWAPELRRFVAIGNRAVVSLDGISWTSRSVPTTGYRINWAPEISSLVVMGPSTTAYFSIDGGDSWSSFNRPTDGATFPFDSAWSPELGRLVVAVYNGGVSIQEYVVDSPAYALTARQNTALRKFRFNPAAPPAWSNEPLSGNWRGAVYAKELGMFVICNYGSVITRSTTGGASWINSSASGLWLAITWAPDINTFVAVGDSGKIAYSTTGATSWVVATYGTKGYWGVAWAPEIRTFVAVSTDGVYARSTDNGVSWVTVGRANSWYDVTWAPQISTFIKVASSGTNRISYSTTGGETWADATLTETALFGVAWSPELARFVAVGSNSVRISTTGGVSWKNGTIPSGTWYRVIWAPEIRSFVAVGSSGIAAFSTTGGETWVQVNRPTTGSSYGIAWSPDFATLLAVHVSNVINRMIIPSTAAANQLTISAGSRTVMTVRDTGITVRGTVSSFTGCHRAEWDPAAERPSATASLNGLVVASTGRMHLVSLDDSIPYIRLACTARDPGVFGVLHVSSAGQLMVNALGEGAVWVCNIGGALANGDYVTSSEVAGYAARQEEEWVDAFTVAKVLFDVDFSVLDTPDPVIPIPEEDVIMDSEAPATTTTDGEAPAAPTTTNGETAAATSPEGETTAATSPEGETTAATTADSEAPATITEGETAPATTTDSEAPATTSEGETTAGATTSEAETTAATTSEAEAPAAVTSPEGEIAEGVATEGDAEAATSEGDAETEPIEEITTEGAYASMAASAAASAKLAVRDRVYYGRTGGTTYEMRHLVRGPDGSVRVVKRAEWLALQAAGEQVFLAAFVGCTYHCA